MTLLFFAPGQYIGMVDLTIYLTLLHVFVSL